MAKRPDRYVIGCPQQGQVIFCHYNTSCRFDKAMPMTLDEARRRLRRMAIPGENVIYELMEVNDDKAT